jgi:hypothetical protein
MQPRRRGHYTGIRMAIANLGQNGGLSSLLGRTASGLPNVPSEFCLDGLGTLSFLSVGAEAIIFALCALLDITCTKDTICFDAHCGHRLAKTLGKSIFGNSEKAICS